MVLKQLITYVLFSFVLFSPLYGVQDAVNSEKPVLYYADSQTYDRELGILILKGHVEFNHEGNVLEADYVTYNELTDIVTASGNVRLRQPNGDVDFAEYMELTGDMKEGLVLQLRTLLQDDSKIAALEGRKFEDHEELDQAVYTPCELCGDEKPTWQINARRALKDNANKNIHFTDAQLRILDTPILYLPYATQPLERRSGFLIPGIGYNSTMGANIEIPYYIVLSEDKDATLSIVPFTDQNPLFLGQYRQRFSYGYLATEGSITNYKKSAKDKKEELVQNFKIPQTRGHVFGRGNFDLNETWRTRVSGGYVSDKTYLRKYGLSGFKNDSNLTSKGILEGFLNPRDYAAAKIYHFQGLRNEDKQSNISSPLPYLEYSGFSGVDSLGGRFNFDGNFLNLYRKRGINMQRGIGEVGWQRPWVASLGQVFTPVASLRGDLYSVEHGKKNRPRPVEKTGGARFFPQAGLNWRWPFVNSMCHQSYIVQPVAQLIAAPDKAIGVEQRHIPNEDSVDFEFNDANLFSFDRFPGYDRIDTGSRGIYGGEFLTTGDVFGDVEVFLGQSYSFSNAQHGDKSQGFGRRPSDYVGRIEASPFHWLTLNYRFRYDQKTWNPRVSEAGGSIGPAILKLAVDYTFLSKHAAITERYANKMRQSGGKVATKDFNQINLTLSSQLTKTWSVMAMLRQNLKKKKKDKNGKSEDLGTLEKGIGALYRDDCFGLGASIRRQYYKDRDLRPATIFAVTLFLKNIGDFNYGFNLDKGFFGEREAKKGDDS